MSFQNPTFLWALLLLAIPVIIHLFNFRKYKKVMFSNVAMLKEIQTESRKTRQVKKWLVLLTRMLAIAALVFAFARPFIPNKNNTEGRQLVSIYLDNSESMRAEGEDGQLFENAKNATREIIQNLPPEAEIQIIDNAFSPFSNRVYSPANAIKIVDDLEIDFHPNDLGAVIQRVNNKFMAEGYGSQHTFALSDFQGAVGEDGPVLDSNINLHLLRSTPSSLQNLSIDSVWLEEPVVKPESPVQLKVRVTNNGSQDVESSSLILKINDVQQGVESFGIPAKSQKVLDMAFTSSTKGWVSGEVSLNDVPVTFDNQYVFALNIKPSIRVLQIGKPNAAISKIFENDKVFSFTRSSEGSIDYAGFGKYDFIILNELQEVGSGLAEQINQFATSGGVVAVFPNANKANYKELSLSLGISSYGAIEKKDLSITPQDIKQPFVRDVYKRIPKNILLPKIKKSFSLKKTIGTKTILSLKDDSPVLLRKRVGAGSVFQYSIPLNTTFNNLSQHELFVLIMLKMSFSKSEKQQLAYSLFSKEAIQIPGKVGSESTVLLEKGEKIILTESASRKGDFRFWLNDEVNESGIYVLKNNKEEEVTRIALNYDRSESVQRFASGQELAEYFAGNKVEVINSKSAAIKKVTDSLSSGTPLWKLFIALCLIFLLIEILLLRFLKS
jgi:hypothetical protein